MSDTTRAMTTTRARLQARIQELETAGQDASAFKAALAKLPPDPTLDRAPMPITVQGRQMDARGLTPRQLSAAVSQMTIPERLATFDAALDALTPHIAADHARRREKIARDNAIMDRGGFS
jgi:hypothetical protein